MKLTVVFTVLGQHEMVNLAIKQAMENSVLPSTKFMIIDNGGNYNPRDEIADERLCIFRPMKDVGTKHPKHYNVGVYPAFKWGMDHSDSEIVAFLHSDIIITELGYDARITQAFIEHERLGLMGFVGSNEIDVQGGRGAGTTSNFQGHEHYAYSKDGGEAGHWIGSPAEAHGKRNAGYTRAAVVDGCAMVIRRDAWKEIGFREKFPPHHFYDRLISTQMIEKTWDVAVLGIACDHLGGQTVSKEQRYPDMAREWCEKYIPQDRWVGNIGQWSWDMTIYREAESQWLREYRDQKHLVPIHV